MATKQAIAAALKQISAVFDSYTISEDKIRAWNDLLEGYTDQEVLTGVRISLLRAQFAPVPRDLVEAIAEYRGGGENAELAWQNPGNGSEIAKEAFRRWGGHQRWRLLPDPRYHENPSLAINTINLERKRYFEIYNSLKQAQKFGPLLGTQESLKIAQN